MINLYHGSNLFEKIPLRDFFENGEKWQFATDDPDINDLQLVLKF